MIRLIDRIELEISGSIRDRIHRAEKKGIIDKSEVFIEIRMIRNDIAHEYLPEAIKSIFKKVLALTPHIIKSVDNVMIYCKKFETNP